MAHQPKISVILPVYNGERYLQQCLESVWAQSYRNFELIVGDDGSTDGSRAILRNASDRRAKVFLFDRNAGLFGNLNRLLREASGELVRFLCQDDMLCPECLAEEAALFEAHPEVAMSICSSVVVDDHGVEIGQWHTTGQPVVYDRHVGIQMFLYYGCVAGNLSTVCARQSSLEELGGFNESFRLAGDYDMWVRVCARGRLADFQKRLIRMREHGSRLSRSAGAGVAFVRENRQIRRHLMTLLPQRLRARARRYVYLRQNVLDTHEFVTCVRHGRLKEVWALLRIMGIRDLLAGLVSWLLTVNNHLYRPRPLFLNEIGEVVQPR